MAFLNELRAAGTISVLGIRHRAAMSLSTVVGIALVVLVLLGFLSMANGFQAMLAGTGSPSVAVVLGKDSKSEMGSAVPASEYRLLGSLPHIASREGQPILSEEVYQAVGAERRNGDYGGITLRGLGKRGPMLRPGVRIVEGRMFSEGSREIVVGRSVQREFPGFDLGKEVRLGGAAWRVAGVFESPGTVWDSEIWGDVKLVQALRGQGNAVQSVRVLLDKPEDLAAFKAAVEADPRLRMSVRSEQEFFKNQSKGTAGLIEALGWPLGLAMALGALAGALNTMYSSVSARSSEIATLRTFGFGGLSTFVATMIEALVLSAAGAALGTGLAVPILNNVSTSTLGANMTQVAFSFDVSAEMVAQAWILALVVGFLGGALPAVRAVRRPILAGLAAEA
jgi:putative ABC transport system permease protein